MVLKTDFNYDIPIDIQDKDVNEIFYKYSKNTLDFNHGINCRNRY